MYDTLLKESAWNRRTVITLSVFCGIVVSVVFYNVFTRRTSGYFQNTRRVLVRQNFTLISLKDIPAVNVNNVNCTTLFSNDAAEMKKANELKSSNLAGSTSPIEYVKQASNCDVFIKQRRYLTSPVNDEEADFPLAFSILLYKDVEQFERLLRAIYRPQNIYCVHVDNKSSTAIKDAVQSVAACFDNVFVSPKLYVVHWGGFTVLAPELTCMEELLRCHKKWKYFINLTGQEFPLKTNWQIVRILKAFDGANSIEGTVRRRSDGRYGGSPAPNNITLAKGSGHIAATRDFVDFVINNEKAKEFGKWVEGTDIPDETFFSSLNHSPQLSVPGAYHGEPETDPKTYPYFAKFKNWGDFPCRGKWSSAICVFGIRDLPLLAKRPELFANKFHADFQPLAYDCLEELHYKRIGIELGLVSQTDNLSTFNFDEYKQFEFVRNHVR